MRQLDLQRAFPRPRARAENFENEPGAVEHLGVPGLFEIALLHRRERVIHDDDPGVVGLDDPGDLFDLAVAEKGRRPQAASVTMPLSTTSRSMARASPTASSRRAAACRSQGRRARRRRACLSQLGLDRRARVRSPCLQGLAGRVRVSRRRGSNQTFSPAGASSAPSNSWTG